MTAFTHDPAQHQTLNQGQTRENELGLDGQADPGGGVPQCEEYGCQSNPLPNAQPPYQPQLNIAAALGRLHGDGGRARSANARSRRLSSVEFTPESMSITRLRKNTVKMAIEMPN